MLRTQRESDDTLPNEQQLTQEQKRCGIHSVGDTTHALPFQVVQLPPSGP